MAETNAVGNQGNQGSTQSPSNQQIPLKTWIGVISHLAPGNLDVNSLFALCDRHEVLASGRYAPGRLLSLAIAKRQNIPLTLSLTTLAT